MGSVAERALVGVLALAVGGFLFLLHFKGKRGHFGSLVRSIAQRLFFGPAAPAPMVVSGFQFEDRGMLEGNFGIRHKRLLYRHEIETEAYNRHDIEKFQQGAV